VKEAIEAIKNFKLPARSAFSTADAGGKMKN